MCNITVEEDVVATLDATEIVFVDTTTKRGNKRTNKIGVDETTVVKELVVQIVQMLNVITVTNIDITQRIAMPRRKFKFSLEI